MEKCAQMMLQLPYLPELELSARGNLDIISTRPSHLTVLCSLAGHRLMSGFFLGQTQVAPGVPR